MIAGCPNAAVRSLPIRRAMMSPWPPLQWRLAAPLLGVLPWLDALEPRALRLQLPDGFR